MPWGYSVYIAISYKSNITISEYPDFGDVSWNSEGFHLLEECFWGTQGNLNSAKHSSNSILRSWRPPRRVPLVLRTGDYLWTRRDRPWIWNSLKLAYVKLAYIHTRKPGRSPTRQYGVLRPFLTCAPSLDFFLGVSRRFFFLQLRIKPIQGIRVTLHVWACVKYVPKQSIP